MNLTLAYHGHSSLSESASGQLLSLAPNLKRDRVAFDAPLLTSLPLSAKDHFVPKSRRPLIPTLERAFAKINA